MRTTVTIEYEMIEELLKETKANSKASAVKEAIREYLKRGKIEKIKTERKMAEIITEKKDKINVLINQLMVIQ